MKLKPLLIALTLIAASQAHAQISEDDLEKDLKDATAASAPEASAEAQDASATGERPSLQDNSLPTDAGRASIDRDEPNLQQEHRFYEMTAKAKPVSDAQWSEMIGSRKEDVYEVQKGDTLWDISKTLFGDGFYWSKLWSENATLENPHQISKGMGIRFLSGSEASAPIVQVVPEKKVKEIQLNQIRDVQGRAPVYREQALKDIAPEELQSAIEIDELVPAPDVPPLNPESKVLKELPGSFEQKKKPHFANYDANGFDAGQRPSYKTAATIIPESYIADKLPVGVGKVSEIEAQEQVASIGQNLFVTMRLAANIGEHYSVVFPRGNIDDPIRGSIGPVMEIGGVIEIFEVVDAEKRVYRAQVINVLNPIRQGSIVLAEKLPTVSFSRRGTRLNIDVRVIGAEGDTSRQYFGENSIVYLDGGAKSGLTAGDVLAVRAFRGSRRDDSGIGQWSHPIALLKIAKVEQTVATALVMQSNEVIHPGDHTGGPIPEDSRKVMGGAGAPLHD